MIRSEAIADAFTALSHISRVEILLALMPHAASGLTVGALSKQTKIPPSSLAHHLREMEAGRVVERIPSGRKTIVLPNLAALAQIATLLTQLCCSGETPAPSERPPQ